MNYGASGIHFDNVASSVRVGPDTWATLYEHSNFGGKSRIISSRSPALDDDDLDNKVSSVRTESAVGKVKLCLETNYGGPCDDMEKNRLLQVGDYKSLLKGPRAGTVLAYYQCNGVDWRVIYWSISKSTIWTEWSVGGQTCLLKYLKWDI